MAEPPQPPPPPKKARAEVEALVKRKVEEQFALLIKEGHDPNEAAAKALAIAKQEAVEEVDASEPAIVAAAAATRSLTAATQGDPLASSKYGPLCLGLAGPFRSICVVGEPRQGKRLLVLDIDHTLYDPSDHGGSKAAVVKADASGFFDESITARCRPGLHDFLTDVYREYDIMVWSASEMTRILKLLQQLGMCAAGHTDYRLVAVLDIDSMSEWTSSEPTQAVVAPSTEGTVLVQNVTVPLGAVAGQQIEVRSITDGSPIVVIVPAGLKSGDVFCVSPPGAMSSLSESCGLDSVELQLALQMSMSPTVGDTGVPAAPIHRARRLGKHIKPLSLIWACSEFSELYSEMNTVIVDDTVDVCRANPRNSIQCSRYFWKDHGTDDELPRLARYLTSIAQSPTLTHSHDCWRDRC